MEPLHLYDAGRVLRVAEQDGTFTLTTRDGEIEITERQLAWLSDVAAPAHLVEIRGRAA